MYLNVCSGLCGLFDSPYAGMGCMHAREGVKKHDIHIKPKSYKLELLGELSWSLNTSFYWSKDTYMKTGVLPISCLYAQSYLF